MIAFPFELRTSEPSLASDGRRGGETCSAGSSLACSKNGYFRGSWHTLLSHSYLWTVYYYVFQTSGLEGHWNQYNLRWGSSPPVDLSKKLYFLTQGRAGAHAGRGEGDGGDRAITISGSYIWTTLLRHSPGQILRSSGLAEVAFFAAALVCVCRLRARRLHQPVEVELGAPLRVSRSSSSPSATAWAPLTASERSFGTRARSHLTPAAPPRRISSRAIYSSVVEAELPRN
jgi:hypothetical protein